MGGKWAVWKHTHTHTHIHKHTHTLTLYHETTHLIIFKAGCFIRPVCACFVDTYFTAASGCTSSTLASSQSWGLPPPAQSRYFQQGLVSACITSTSVASPFISTIGELLPTRWHHIVCELPTRWQQYETALFGASMTGWRKSFWPNMRGCP